MSDQVPQVELIKVGSDQLQGIRYEANGWLAVKSACEALGVDYSAQRQRLDRQAWATVGVIPSVGTDGRKREMFCLRADRVAMWLATIDTSRLANDAAREKLELWQCQAAEVLDRWVRGEQPGGSEPVRIDPALLDKKLNVIGDMVAHIAKRQQPGVELEIDGIKLKLPSVDAAMEAIRKLRYAPQRAALPVPTTPSQSRVEAVVVRRELNTFMLNAARRCVGQDWKARRNAWSHFYDTLASRGFDARALRAPEQTLISVLEEHNRIAWALEIARELFPLPQSATPSGG